VALEAVLDLLATALVTLSLVVALLLAPTKEEAGLAGQAVQVVMAGLLLVERQMAERLLVAQAARLTLLAYQARSGLITAVVRTTVCLLVPAAAVEAQLQLVAQVVQLANMEAVPVLDRPVLVLTSMELSFFSGTRL